MTTLHLIFAWLSAPAHFVIWWPVFTGLCSLAYTQADATKAGHKALSTLASLGLDLPKLLSIAKSFFGGGGGSADATQKREVPSVPPRGTSVMRYGALAMLVLMPGCAWFQKHETQIATLSVDMIECVDEHVNDPPLTIVEECGMQAIPGAVSIIASRKALAEKREAAVLASLSHADAGACK